VDRIVEVEFGGNLSVSNQVLKVGGTISAYGSMADPAPQLPFYPMMFNHTTLHLLVVYLLSGAERRRALVTGSASGIGLATATLLAESGAHVAMNDLPGDALTAAVHDLDARGFRVAAVPGDLGVSATARAVCVEALDLLGGLDRRARRGGQHRLGGGARRRRQQHRLRDGKGGPRRPDPRTRARARARGARQRHCAGVRPCPSPASDSPRITRR
jgi:hypothetical protein